MAVGGGVLVGVAVGAGVEVFVGMFVGVFTGMFVGVSIGNGVLVAVESGRTVGTIVFVGGSGGNVGVDDASNAIAANRLESMGAADCSVGSDSKPSTMSCSYSQLLSKNRVNSSHVPQKHCFFDNVMTGSRYIILKTGLSVLTRTQAKIQHCDTTNLRRSKGFDTFYLLLLETGTSIQQSRAYVNLCSRGTLMETY